jgi:hypothetical protein
MRIAHGISHIIAKRQNYALSRILGSPRKKQHLAWRAGPTRLGVPREKTGAEKEKKNMIEEIKARQTNQEQSKTLPSAEKAARRKAEKLFVHPSHWQVELMCTSLSPPGETYFAPGV